MMLTPELVGQIINLLAAVMLLISFAMIAQRRVITLVDLFALQGFVLMLSTGFVAYTTGQTHLWYSAGITLLLKVLLLPWILHRLIRKLNVKWEFEGLINVPTTMLLGIVLVILSFNLALPIARVAGTITRGTVGIALAAVLLAFLMMIIRSKAIPQVIGLSLIHI